MSFDYANTAASVLRMLTRFGTETTLTHVDSSAYDPADSSGTNVETTDTVTAVVFPIDARHIDGTSVIAGDQTAYLIGGTTPKAGDKLTWAGSTLRVVNVKSYAPAGVTTVLQELQVRA